MGYRQQFCPLMEVHGSPPRIHCLAVVSYRSNLTVAAVDISAKYLWRYRAGEEN